MTSLPKAVSDDYSINAVVLMQNADSMDTPMFEQFFHLNQLAASVVELLQYFTYLFSLLSIPLPVGIIGGWRWGMWLFRKFIGLFYRPMQPTGYMATTSIVIPVYNENPDVFRLALRSWLTNRPTEIIAVIDHSDEQCLAIYREFQASGVAYSFWKTDLKLVITKKPGKRPALVDGTREATGDIVFLVDSDTIWDEDVLVTAIAPFVNPKVGGVTTRQNVWQPNSIAQRVFDVYLDIRYADEVRYLTAFSDVVTCLSGRTAVYRRTAIVPVLDDLMNETFMGKKVISGDDKCLTLLVQAAGWKVAYQENARVYTPGTNEFKLFQKQRLRWARNSWRADFKTLFSHWAWRKPFLFFHLIDRLFQPLTTLVAPIYCLFCIYHQQWLTVCFLLLWWSLSRSVKIWPHLSRGFSNIQILPWFIGISYWFAIVRIYAFFTMNQQGWITRWSSNRMAAFGPLRLLPGYLGTALTLLMITLFINTIHDKPAERTTESHNPQTVISAGQPESLPAGANSISQEKNPQEKNPWPVPTSDQVVPVAPTSQDNAAPLAVLASEVISKTTSVAAHANYPVLSHSVVAILKH